MPHQQAAPERPAPDTGPSRVLWPARHPSKIIPLPLLGSPWPDHYLAALDRLVELLARIRDRHGAELPELDLGGGHGVRYLPGDPELAPADLAAAVTARLAARCAEHGLAVPKLTVEPGRAIAAPAAGAYQLSMASGYNHVGRPVLAAVRDGRIRLLIRRESVDDFRAREVGR